MPDTSTHLAAAFGKWPGLFARLALTFHLVEAADTRAQGTQPPALTLISEATAKRTADFMQEVLLPHLLRAHAVMFSSAQTSHARWIAGHILAEKLDSVTARNVMRAYRALRPAECRSDLLTAMANLVAVGWLEPVATNNREKPVSTWTVNPEVHVEFATKAERERETRAEVKRQIAENVEVIRDMRGEKGKVAPLVTCAHENAKSRFTSSLSLLPHDDGERVSARARASDKWCHPAGCRQR